MRQARLHPLKRNDHTWTPRLVAFFDTEFPADPERPEAPQMFRCACAKWRRRSGKSKRGRPGDLRTTDSDQLATWVEMAAEPGTPLWLYAHHAAVDVHSSGLLDALLRSGWRISRHGLANPTLWALFVKGRQSIHLCDSVSLFGVSLEALGAVLGRPKSEMPGYGDDEIAWLDYCERDVDIGLDAVCRCMDDWERNDMGRWTDTGAGCGWNSLRHTLRQGDVWISPEREAQAFERKAIYGGRRELLQFGRLPEWEYADLDLSHAHLTAAACFPLPASRGQHFKSLALDSPFIGSPSVGVIARVLLRVSQPRYPYRTPFGVVHPVGEFVTSLCGPEIAEARARGELVAVLDGYQYSLKHWAHRWAQWACRVLDGQEHGVGTLLSLLVKGASKTVWGRTAMRVTGTTSVGDGPTDELRLERGYDSESGAALTIVDQGWTRTVELLDQESDDSFPAILAWIQSHVRVAIGRTVDAIGQDAIAQIATDGVLVAPARLAQIAAEASVPVDGVGDTADFAAAACAALSGHTAPFRLRLKDVLHRVSALAPEVVEYEEGRKVSGVPRGAKRVSAWTYEGEVWPSLVTMTQEPLSGAVSVRRRVWRTGAARPLRWIYADGCCEPLRLAPGAPEPAPAGFCPPEPVCRHAAALRADQHPRLAPAAEGHR